MELSVRRRTAYAALAFAFVAAMILIALPEHSGAAALSRTFVRFDRMKTSTQTTGTVCAQAATASTEASV